MQTQLTCPACQSPFMGDVHQIVDVGLHPEMKQLLLTGALNVVQCPACGTPTRVSTPFLYHDPEHEHFLVYVPMEMGVGHSEQETIIGQLVRRAMDQLPAEERRGYMFQPQTILSMQTLIDTVLESEGVTPEMLARQRSQRDLLQTLLDSDRKTADELIAAHTDEIDEQFFAMIGLLIETAEQSGQNETLLDLMNLRAKLYRDTNTGQRLEARQLALHAFNQEAKNAEGISPELLLKHVLANRKDPDIVEALVMSAVPALNYDFFLLLSEKIEKRERSGIDASEFIALRDRLLALQQEIERQSRQVLERASQTLQFILSAEDRRQAVRDNLDKIDDGFMYVLNASISQAEESGDSKQASVLIAIYELIREELEPELPQEINLLNQIMSIEDDTERGRLIDETPEMQTPEFLELVRAVADQAADSGRTDLNEHLKRVQAMIQARMTA
ncbi:MAG: CpXC domain-containing protein [Chloroflexota bacterium]|nr:MAG: CpXC domain-containing protein [Chloroflexota bacterium]